MTSIRTSGPAIMTESGLEVVAFHLHRFLAVWMEAHHIDRLFVTLGFEHTLCQCATLCIELHAADPVEVGWSYEDLCQIHQRGDGRLYLEPTEESDLPHALLTLPILDRPALGGSASLALGFVLLPQQLSLDSEQLAQLQTRTYEAICAARRNAMRLFFDEHRADDIKALLYAFMEHLPEWIGCDEAAATLLTSSLETMTLDEAFEAEFNVLAERVYSDDPSDAPERLVGMTLTVNDQLANPNVLASAFARQRQDPELPYHIFLRDQGLWHSADTGECSAPLHRLRERPMPAMLVLVPLVAHDGKEAELIGFLSLTWRSCQQLSSSTGHLLSDLSEHLGPLLRHSSLYSLSARKLWILGEMRRTAERAIATSQGADHWRDERDALIKQIIGLIAARVPVPSVSAAYMEHDPTHKRSLRYVHPHGWSHYEQLSLPVDVTPEQRTDSGVSSLAVRLNRQLVLAGGYGEGEQFGFKNALFVHEESRRVVDVRSGMLASATPDETWVALSDYYKPARAHAYATLAYPITFDDQPIGVLTLEVDRHTDWLWWTGFGGHLFWQLVAAELASAFYALGVRPTP